MGASLPLPGEHRLLSHLRALAVLHYVFGGLQLLACMGLGAFLAFGIGHEHELNQLGQSADDRAAGVGTIAIFSVLLLISIVSTLLQFFAAEMLRRQRRLTLCLLCAGWNCMWLPLGTALGIYALVVLLDPQMKPLFATRTGTAIPARGTRT